MVNDDGFLELVQSRRSIRRYQQRPIAQSVLEELLTAATWAPSAHNRQPWRFCVVTSAATKFALSERMGEQWRKDLTVTTDEESRLRKELEVARL